MVVVREPALVMSLDPTIAFNTLEWIYMFAVLDKMGFGPQYKKWIVLLYRQPMARV